MISAEQQGWFAVARTSPVEVISSRLGLRAAQGAELAAADVAAKEGTTVFSAVDATEAASINSSGKFLLNPGGTEVKYFARSLKEAEWYGSRLYPNGYKIIESTVKNTVDISKYWYPNIDIGAYAFPQEILPYIIPK